jgi:hypothetical protein
VIHRLQKLASVPLEIVWHENKTTYFSVKKERGCLYLRIHRLFYDAPTPVLEAVIRYAMKRDPQSGIILKQMAYLYFSRNLAEAIPLPTQGSVYDLQKIFNKILTYLPVEGVTIGWSPRNRKGKFRSLTFGTYDKHRRQIRIHPILDDREVPLYFLEFIVYHEMLHAVCSSVMDSNGRCIVHTKEFRQKERQFPDFQRAKDWEKGCLTFFKKRKSHGRA